MLRVMKTIRLFAILRELAGAREVTIPFSDGQTVREMLRAIAEIHPALGAKMLTPEGEMTGLVHVLVHGRNIMWLDGLDTVVHDTDNFDLLPPSAGG